MEQTILDVSRHQGTIDWATVKASGKVDGVMLRALGSRNGKPYLDPQFTRNYSECARLGIPVGVYWYSTATTQAAANAELAALRSALAGKTLQLPVALDAESAALAALDRTALSDLAAYLLDQVEQMGFYALLYTYLNFASLHFDMTRLAARYDVWLAAYRKTRPATNYPYGMWQYTSTARVPGISVNVDLSEAYKDYAGIIRRKGLDHLKGV